MPKDPPQPIKKGSQSSDKPTKDDKTSSKDGKQAAEDDDKHESSQPRSKPKRTDTGSSSGSGGLSGLQRIASGIKGSKGKASSSTATSKGDVQLFKSIKGNDGKVSPKKLLGVIFENMTITPAMRGRKFIATAPKGRSLSPASSPQKSESQSPPRWEEAEGVEAEGRQDHWPAHAASIPVSTSGNFLPKPKPRNHITWHIPYDRDQEGTVVEWYAEDLAEGASSLGGLEKGARDAIKDDLLSSLKAKNAPGEKEDLTIHLYMYQKIEEYEDQTAKDVTESLDHVIKQGNGLNIQVNVMFNPRYDDSLRTYEATNPTVNWVRVLLMLLQDQYDEQAQTANDAIIAREVAQQDSGDERKAHIREARRSRKKARDGSPAHGGRQDEISVHDWTPQQDSTGKAPSRAESKDSVGSGRSTDPRLNRIEERWERGQEDYHAEFSGSGIRRQR
jgi:hypothetical protein